MADDPLVSALDELEAAHLEMLDTGDSSDDRLYTAAIAVAEIYHDQKNPKMPDLSPQTTGIAFAYDKATGEVSIRPVDR